MISHKHRFIFVHINKTGGTSIEKVFVQTADKQDVHFKHKDGQFYSRRFPSEFSSYFKFAFVRNPWDWVVSRYVWSRYHQKLFDCDLGTFLDKIERQEVINPEAPWLLGAMRPQADRLLVDDAMAMDFVGRFERLQADFNTVCKQIGVSPVTLPVVFKTERTHYARYYDDAMQEQVFRMYQKDIQLFGYAFETGN